MTADELQDLSLYPLFPKTAKDLILVAGLEAAAALITAWPGQDWPIPVRAGGASKQGEKRYAQLQEIVGDAAAKRIVTWGAGGTLIVPNLKVVIHQRNQERARQLYDQLIRDGYSSREAIFEIGIKFLIAKRTMEKIVNQPNCQLVESQGNLF